MLEVSNKMLTIINKEQSDQPIKKIKIANKKRGNISQDLTPHFIQQKRRDQ